MPLIQKQQQNDHCDIVSETWSQKERAFFFFFSSFHKPRKKKQQRHNSLSVALREGLTQHFKGLKLEGRVR